MKYLLALLLTASLASAGELSWFPEPEQEPVLKKLPPEAAPKMQFAPLAVENVVDHGHGLGAREERRAACGERNGLVRRIFRGRRGGC